MEGEGKEHEEGQGSAPDQVYLTRFYDLFFAQHPEFTGPKVAFWAVGVVLRT